MSFLNAIGFWGPLALAGVAVPVIIHLLHQRHRRHTDWAAMELLKRAMVIRSGQVRLEDLLLLLLRCLVLALVALAMARPILEDKVATTLGGERRVGLVLALDASYGMGHGKLESRFDRAKQRAAEVLETVRPGDPVTLVLLGERPRVLKRAAGYDEGSFRKVLEGAQPLPESLDLERSATELAALVGELKASTVECYFVTDAQTMDWTDLSQDAASILSKTSEDASLYVLPIDAGGKENLAVTNFAYVSGSLGQGGMARFTATIKNFGEQESDGASATFHVNGDGLESPALGNIPPGQEKHVSFLTSFDEPGDARVSVELSVDALATDNARHLVVKVPERVKILCVDGEAASGSKLGETHFLEKALRLKNVGDDAALVVERCDWRDLEVETLSEYEVVVLANVPNVSEGLAGRLEKFVRKGGGIIFFAGGRVDPEVYGDSLRALLPGDLLEPVSFLAEGETPKEGVRSSWTFGPISSGHVLARALEKIPPDGRDAGKFHKVMKVKPDLDADVLLTLSDPDLPLLLEKRIGEGISLLVSTSADRDWANLASHPYFPILMQHAVTYLTSRPDQGASEVGSKGRITFQGKQAGSTVPLKEPGEQESREAQLSATVAGATVCEFDLERPGFYVVEEDGGSALASNLNPAEGDVRTVSPDVLGETLRKSRIEAVVIPPEEENLASVVKAKREGMEISRTLLILALLVFLLQGYLAKRFTNRMTGDVDVVENLRRHTVAAARKT